MEDLTKQNRRKKFNHEQVESIRSKYLGGATIFGLAKEYGSNYRTVRAVLRGEYGQPRAGS